jgi:hypothetical protein
MASKNELYRHIAFALTTFSLLKQTGPEKKTVVDPTTIAFPEHARLQESSEG